MRGLNGAKVGWMRKRVLAVCLVICVGMAAAPIASAQTATYPPTTLPSICLSISGAVELIGGIIEILFQGTITISGPAGCAQDGETIDLSVASDPVSLGSATANSDGSYSLSATLPASITPGQHEITADFGPGRAQLVQPILVVTSFPTGAAAGANTGPTSNGANLPKTGADIARLVMWAMVLLVVGAGLIFYRRRRFGQLAVAAGALARLRPNGASKRRRKRRRVDDKQLVRADTTKFVPEKVERRKLSEDVEEWPFFTPPDS